MSNLLCPPYSELIYSKAKNALPVILGLAPGADVMYYSELMRKIGCSRRNIGKILYLIDVVARRLHLPRINLLIVLKATNLPSDRCEIYYGNHDEFKSSCLDINWESAGPRFQNEFLSMMNEREFNK